MPRNAQPAGADYDEGEEFARQEGQLRARVKTLLGNLEQHDAELAALMADVHAGCTKWPTSWQSSGEEFMRKCRADYREVEKHARTAAGTGIVRDLVDRITASNHTIVRTMSFWLPDAHGRRAAGPLASEAPSANGSPAQTGKSTPPPTVKSKLDDSIAVFLTRKLAAAVGRDYNGRGGHEASAARRGDERAPTATKRANATETHPTR